MNTKTKIILFSVVGVVLLGLVVLGLGGVPTGYTVAYCSNHAQCSQADSSLSNCPANTYGCCVDGRLGQCNLATGECYNSASLATSFCAGSFGCKPDEYYDGYSGECKRGSAIKCSNHAQCSRVCPSSTCAYGVYGCCTGSNLGQCNATGVCYCAEDVAYCGGGGSSGGGSGSGSGSGGDDSGSGGASTCTDTDGGLNADVFGECTDARGVAFSDVCWKQYDDPVGWTRAYNDSCDPPNCGVLDLSCDDSVCVNHLVLCLSGCANGVCLLTDMDTDGIMGGDTDDTSGADDTSTDDISGDISADDISADDISADDISTDDISTRDISARRGVGSWFKRYVFFGWWWDKSSSSRGGSGGISAGRWYPASAFKGERPDEAAPDEAKDYALVTYEFIDDEDLRKGWMGAGGAAPIKKDWAARNSEKGVRVEIDQEDGFEELVTGNSRRTHKLFLYAEADFLHIFWFDSNNNKWTWAGKYDRSIEAEHIFADVRFSGTKAKDAPIGFIGDYEQAHILVTFNDDNLEIDPDDKDDFAMYWTTPTKFEIERLGNTADRAEATDVIYGAVPDPAKSAAIGTVDYDMQNKYATIILDPETHADNDKVMFNVPNISPLGN